MRDISIIVPTYNRASFLEACLTSACEQTLDPQRYEVCIIDNASTDNTAEVVAQVASRYPYHHLFRIEEPVLGVSRARNTGLRATEAPLVASLDSDGWIEEDWAERFVARYAEFGSELAIVGGEIAPIWKAPKPDWLTPRMQCFLSAGSDLGPEPRFLKGQECTGEGNTCYRRSSLEEIGNFPEDLGRIGNNLLSGENVVDSLLMSRGHKIFFDPKIILHHVIHADRLSCQWLRRRFFWQGVTGVAVRRFQMRRGVPVDTAIVINLPLNPDDWSFLKQDTPDNLEQSLETFQSLGFVLALTGIMPVE